MSTQSVTSTDRLFLTTDDMQNGFVVGSSAARVAGLEPTAPPMIASLDGTWATLLRGEIEEAVDTILLRATLASTLTLTGRNDQLFG